MRGSKFHKLVAISSRVKWTRPSGFWVRPCLQLYFEREDLLSTFCPSMGGDRRRNAWEVILSQLGYFHPHSGQGPSAPSWLGLTHWTTSFYSYARRHEIVCLCIELESNSLHSPATPPPWNQNIHPIQKSWALTLLIWAQQDSVKKPSLTCLVTLQIEQKNISVPLSKWGNWDSGKGSLRHDRRRPSPALQASEESDSHPSLQDPLMGWPGTWLQMTWGHPALDNWPCLSKAQRAVKSSHGSAVRAKLPLVTLSVLQVVSRTQSTVNSSSLWLCDPGLVTTPL